MIEGQHGRHQFKLGAEYKHHEFAGIANFFSRGQINFLGLSGNSFRDFLGGFSGLTGLTIIGSGIDGRSFRAQDWAGFLHDTWHVAERFTLDWGIRYEYFSPFTESRGQYVGIDPERLVTVPLPTGGVALTGGFVQAGNAATPLPGVPQIRSSLVQPDRNNLVPRFGFAWQPFSERTQFVLRGGYGIYLDRPNARFTVNQILNFPYYVLAQAVATPVGDPFVQVPTADNFPLDITNREGFPFGGPPLLLPAATPSGVAGVPANGIFPDIHNFRTPYVQQYSLGVQKGVGDNWLLDLGYVGTAGRKLFRLAGLNQATVPVPGAPGPLSPGLSSLALQAFGVHLMQSSSNSSYNSLQFSVKRRPAQGLESLLSYTYSHALDDYSGDLTRTNDLTIIPGDQIALSNRGNSDFDRRHRLVFSGGWQLPDIFTGTSGLARLALNGWSLSGVLTWQSGTAFSVLSSANVFVQARADQNPANPDCDAKRSGPVESRLSGFFDTSCFVPATNGFGNTGRNILRGPNQRNLDIAVSKLFTVSERIHLDFRAESFNTLNLTNFSNPTDSIENARAGEVVGPTTSPRVIQFGLKLAF